MLAQGGARTRLRPATCAMKHAGNTESDTLPRVNLKKSNQLKNNNQFVRGGSPRLRGNIGYCHLVVEQVGGSHHRSPESPCGTLRMLHAVMQATPAAVAGHARSSSASRGDVSVRWYVSCEVWGLERACTCGAGVVYSRCAASTCG